ncbi:MAG: hypothetical protein KAI40_06000 [Desulfobacterales bacterium]|nr:hypothetical protein [Desulfobacterales bacterium]
MAKENDLVLIYAEDSPVTFARVEGIEPDSKKNWYHIKLLMLQIPLQIVTWILKNDYINGEEFSMGGKKMRIEVVESPKEDVLLSEIPFSDQKADNTDSDEPQGGKIISFNDVKKFKKKDGPDKK